VLHWFRALEVTPDWTGTDPPHVHVLLVVTGEYFGPGSPLYISQDEWHRMWKPSLWGDRSTCRRHPSGSDDVAKYRHQVRCVTQTRRKWQPSGSKRCTMV